MGPRLRSSECHFEKPTVLQTFPFSAMTCANTSSTTGLRTHSAREAFTVVVRWWSEAGGRTADLPLFREQSYHALSRQDAARRADLGTYQA